MALLTQSEAVAFNGFLASVDFSDVLEWSAVAADGNIPIPPAPEKGKEAVLAKAAKDLMSLESNMHTTEHEGHASQRTSSVESHMAFNSNWPNLPGDSSSSEQQRRTHSYTYGFGAPSRTSHKMQLPSANAPGGPSQAIPENLFNYPQPHSPSRGSPLSNLSSHSASNNDSSSSTAGRPSHNSASSAPSVLDNHRSSSTKRGVPHDTAAWPGGPGSAESSKRRRPSEAPSVSPTEEKQAPSNRSRVTRASSTSSSVLAGPSSSSKASTGDTVGPSTASSASGPNSKPALLSPSQKRANHIQSEQKRRANIRRGYEALCDAVPALREAIRLEDEAAAARAAEEEAQGRTKRKRRGKAAAEEAADRVGDGRAGPKSENVVLQKTIEHLFSLLAEQDALKARLIHARGILPHGHPALGTSADHVDDKGVPLWEREWNGGNGWKGDGEDGDDD
ncbi:hypothetical protein BDW22DRAFT_1352639 [Trametopsis cervina]|nr:hypothetical protein BDW22DRAFT_1352639 [Trametopsis cervina]